MDPQQRLLLETSLGGVRARRASTRRRCAGSRTGVFAGVDVPGLRRPAATGVPEDVEGYLGTGSAGSVASGRVAYTLRVWRGRR